MSFTFPSGLPDCCTSDPKYYTVAAEIPNARLVKMVVPPGEEDTPHEHPAHSLYFAKAAKLFITDYDEAGKPKEGHEVEVPAGAPPIFPPGAHQVKNAGEEESLVLFVEAYPTCTPCGDIPDYISPFTVKPECYKLLAENDDWITGMLEMAPGDEDPVHHHRDHLIYVLEGDEVTLTGEDGEPHAVPIAPGAGNTAGLHAARRHF